MLHQRSSAPCVQSLQSVADSQNRLALAVGILEQKLISSIALCVCWSCGSLLLRAVLLGVNISFAAGQEDGCTTADRACNRFWSRLKGNRHSLSAAGLDGLEISRERSSAVLLVIRAGLRNGNKRLHFGRVLVHRMRVNHSATGFCSTVTLQVLASPDAGYGGPAKASASSTNRRLQFWHARRAFPYRAWSDRPWKSDPQPAGVPVSA